MLSRRMRRSLFTLRLNRLLFITMLLQLIPYWTSPEVSARYLYCILPFVLLFSYKGFSWISSFSSRIEWKNYTLLPLTALLLVFSFLAQFFELAPTITNTGYVYFSTVAIMGFALLVYIPRSKLPYTYLLMSVLVFARLSYDVHLLPRRAVEHAPLKKGAYAVAEFTKGSSLCLYKETWLQDGSSFYITKAREEILARCKASKASDYMLVDKRYIEEVDGEKVMELLTRYKKSPVSLIKVKHGVM